ncbi:MAG: leucyl/phenylalanyl-tRNA--protein transferase [Treponema sp.]|nr:leucyl/phenylalanyl-tRNA--protein transferase [Treponema sp.]
MCGSVENLPNGPDENFPYLDENERFSFPDPAQAQHDSVVAWGGNLSPGMLLSAYEQGLFPWYSEGDPVIWHSPDPRFVLFPENLHVSASMKKTLRRGEFNVSFDRDFRAVITACAQTCRPGQDGTWITADMIAAYTKLHSLGWAHSAEAYRAGELSGGCYGIRMGDAFFAESMFFRASNASKAALLTLAQTLFAQGVRFIDCQAYTRHVQSLGAVEISRCSFLALLRETRESGLYER